MSYTGLFKSNVVILNCKIVEHTPQFHFKYSLAFFIPCTYVVFIMIQSGYYDQRTLPDIHMLQEINLFITVGYNSYNIRVKISEAVGKKLGPPLENQLLRARGVSFPYNQSIIHNTNHPSIDPGLPLDKTIVRPSIPFF